MKQPEKKAIPKVYDPKEVEEKWYNYWLEKGLCNTEPPEEKGQKKTPYTIVIPPPNVTDVLHMGHAYNNTIQDVLIRYHRMKGHEALWMPGTDHAGIATQNVVERTLEKEGLSRHDLGRERFVKRVWQWKEHYGSVIINQLKKLGASCDWRRERFTMDEGLSRAVTEVFVRLYEKGLIYRGKYIINWCPRCQTALSDEEVPHQETDGSLWYIRYPFIDGERGVVVATTRPETMLGDVAVAVNPHDKRYKALVGKKILLPVAQRIIPIIEDDFVSTTFGTGAVKVTPAHDPNDFLMGQRHNLEPVVVMREDGTMSEEAGKYEGKDRFQCRKELVEELKTLGLLEKAESHRLSIGRCQRCSTIVEPFLSEQWFVRMRPLAEPGIRAVKEDRIRFHPERWTKVYLNWMENIRDWCISRQLWWGHRIPVYYCQRCENMMVAREKPQECSQCHADSSHIVQDEDVLDTWFSSQLWPFSTMGWPDETPELKYYYPTDCLVTGPDIIFFWVARMVMSGLEFMGDVPFKTVYIHGIIRDSLGRKMSKSLGNGIDPLEMIELFSADSVRFTLLTLGTGDQDINLSPEMFEMGRNFSNKLWNAYRLLAMNLKEPWPILEPSALPTLKRAHLSDRWILSRFVTTCREVTEALDNLALHEAQQAIYHFFWHDYCDWYLELIKDRLKNPDDEAGTIALSILLGSMSLLHPFMPFITEEIWQAFGPHKELSLMVSSWIEPQEALMDSEAERQMGLLQQSITFIRTTKSEMKVPLKKKIEAILRPLNPEVEKLLQEHRGMFLSLAATEISTVIVNIPPQSVRTFLPEVEVYIPLSGLVDLEKERDRLLKEKAQLEENLEKSRQKLENPAFLQKAPPDVVEREKKRQEEVLTALQKVDRELLLLR